MVMVMMVMVVVMVVIFLMETLKMVKYICQPLIALQKNEFLINVSFGSKSLVDRLIESQRLH